MLALGHNNYSVVGSWRVLIANVTFRCLFRDSLLAARRRSTSQTLQLENADEDAVSPLISQRSNVTGRQQQSINQSISQSINQSISLYRAIVQRRGLQCGYAESKRNVLRRILNVLTDGAVRQFSGREFQSLIQISSHSRRLLKRVFLKVLYDAARLRLWASSSVVVINQTSLTICCCLRNLLILSALLLELLSIQDAAAACLASKRQQTTADMIKLALAARN